MSVVDLHWTLGWFSVAQGTEPGGIQALGQMLDAGLEVTVVLLSFTLAIFVLLTFAVRAVMIWRKLPVPVDPVDMARPRGFRGLMLASAALLAPLVATYFVSVPGAGPQSFLLITYGLELLLAAALWFVLKLFYRVRERRSGRTQ
jgi:hypothetical protein